MDAWLKKSNPTATTLNVPAKPSGEGSSKASTSKGGSPVKAFQLLQPPPNIHVEAKPREIDPTSVPWVEKYRPKTIEDVSAQEHTIQVLRKTLASSNLPHMLFYGPPGTGKTSTILALAKQLFGPTIFKSRVLELNASDERGISIVREKIKNFAKVAVSQPDSKYPCPPYKIIILDEADSMTQDAQSALRRIMETYSRITRFCLVCNYVTRIIEPITSRCSKFRFKPLDSSNAVLRLRTICDAESVNCQDAALEKLIKISEGDLRRAIQTLQSASRLHAGEEITVPSVEEIGGVIPERLMAELGVVLGLDAYDSAEDGDVKMGDKLKGKSEFEVVQTMVAKVVREGYSAPQILSQIHDLFIMHPLLPSRPKAAIALVLGAVDKNLSDGADEELQLLDLCLQIRKAVKAG